MIQARATVLLSMAQITIAMVILSTGEHCSYVLDFEWLLTFLELTFKLEWISVCIGRSQVALQVGRLLSQCSGVSWQSSQPNG